MNAERKLSSPADAKAYFDRGLVRQASGDLSGAIQDFTRAIEINRHDAVAYINCGVARQNSGDLAGAIEDYTRALEIGPKLAEAYTNRGAARHFSGDLKGAIEDHTQAIKIDPRYVEAYINRGYAYWTLAEKDAANAQEHLKAVEEDLAKALEVAPPNWEYRQVVEGTLKRAQEQRAKLGKES